MRVALAGFGPFPGAPDNPSAAVAKALARRRRPALAGHCVTAHIFATTYAAVDRDLPKLLAGKPDIVLVFGVAGRRRHVCVELRARNAMTVLFPDASGYRPKTGAIEPGAPDRLSSRAPFARLLGALQRTGVPARLSRDAGRYLCNYVYWRGLRLAEHGPPLVQFIHIPALRRKARPRRASRAPSPTLADVTRAAENLLIALIAASGR